MLYQLLTATVARVTLVRTAFSFLHLSLNLERRDSSLHSMTSKLRWSLVFVHLEPPSAPKGSPSHPPIPRVESRI